MTPEFTEIKGMRYGAVRMDPLRGGRLAARVGRVLAAAVADSGTTGIGAVLEMFKVGQEGAEQSLIDNPAILQSLLSGAKALDTDALYDAGLEFARGNLFAGDRKLHDETAMTSHFAQHPDHLIPVIAWVLKINCAGFFGTRAPA